MSFGGGAITLPLPSLQLPCFFRSPAVRQVLMAGEEQASWAVAEAAVLQPVVSTAVVPSAPVPPNLLATAAAESVSDAELLLLVKLLAALRQSSIGGAAASDHGEPSCSDRGSAPKSPAESSTSWHAPSGPAQRIEELERELQETHHDLDQLLKLLEEKLRQQPPQSQLRLDEASSAPAQGSRMDRQVRTTSGQSNPGVTAVRTTLWTPELAGGQSTRGPYHRGITLLPPVEPSAERY